MTKQREIKFRAWDKKEEKMFEVWELKGIWSDPEPRDAMVVLWNDTGDEESNTKEIFLMDTILMQYTGVKDKNGKEIWEGDIVEFNYGSLGSFQEQIQFIDGGFWIKRKDGSSFMPSEDVREVIGNIYENPELLK